MGANSSCIHQSCLQSDCEKAPVEVQKPKNTRDRPLILVSDADRGHMHTSVEIPRSRSCSTIWPSSNTSREQSLRPRSVDLSFNLLDCIGLEGLSSEEMPDGSMYTGEKDSEGRKNGKGSEFTVDGKQYTGFFKKGLREGIGKLVLPSGSVYEGTFSKNKARGVGVLHRSNGSVYRGEFKNNVEHGKGVLMYKDGSECNTSFPCT